VNLLKKYKFLSLFIVVSAAAFIFTQTEFSNFRFQPENEDTNVKTAISKVEEKSLLVPEEGFQIISIPMEDPESTDEQIEKYMKSLFPIITDFEILVIQGSKEISKKLVNDTLGIVDFRLNFKVPEHYLDPHPKILWELNIPEFTSRIYQLYKNDTILIDTWPNVVGAPSTRTYTGHYEAFRIRNWPSWKDPDSDPAEPATPPGPGNPLGLFAVHYDENSLRYFHGTNKNYLLKNEYRALSHGCVRNDNSNIEKMKQFIVNKVIVSEDLSWWAKSKKSMMFNFADEDKFPVRIKYKTFNVSSDGYGDYIVFFKDVYRYEDGSGWSRFDDPELMTFATKENILADYKAGKKPNQFSIADEKLIPIIEKLIAKHQDYEKYYFEDLLSESGE
jgi:hypothetical protein